MTVLHAGEIGRLNEATTGDNSDVMILLNGVLFRFPFNSFELSNITTVTDTTYNVLATDDHIDYDDTGGAITASLPASPVTGKQYSHSKIGNTANVVISGNGKNINGSSTHTLTVQYATIVTLYTGTEWRIV